VCACEADLKLFAEVPIAETRRSSSVLIVCCTRATRALASRSPTMSGFGSTGMSKSKSSGKLYIDEDDITIHRQSTAIERDVRDREEAALQFVAQKMSHE
jgi:hypothetical protein